jgi:hypothetical protein
MWLGPGVAAVLALSLTSSPAVASRPPVGDSIPTQVMAQRAPIGAATIGRLAPGGPFSCFPYAYFQEYVDPGNALYSVPYDGVVTSFAHYAGATAGRIQALFFVPTTPEFTYNLAHRSTTVSVTPNVLNVFPARIAVHAGEILSLRLVDANQRCFGTGGLVDQAAGQPFTDTQASLNTSDPAGFTNSHVFVNISAVVEPDQDGDGYGDVTQDACPQLATAHDPCPAPAVTVTKAPPRKTSKRRVQIRFTSNVTGSTFGCSVDGRAFKACHSPFRGRFPLGIHTVRILATSAVGVAAQPVTVQFKVVKPKA